MSAGRWFGGVLLLVLAGCQLQAGSDMPDGRQYQRDVEQWRAQRMTRLRAADGWLSYIGSGRLKPGIYSVGSAASNAVVLPTGPAQLGMLTISSDGSAKIDGHPGSSATLNGQPLRHARLRPGGGDNHEVSRIRFGSAEFYLVRSGNVLSWRCRDAGSPRRSSFRGIDHFPVEPAWRVVAHWQPFAKPLQTILLTSIGTPQPALVPGEAVFEVDGRSYRLQPALDAEAPPSKRLFFLFTDRTSGRETYGGARYLYAAESRDGTVVLDFNRAENPPCALTPHVICPIAPAVNRLDLAVTAGEKFQAMQQ